MLSILFITPWIFCGIAITLIIVFGVLAWCSKQFREWLKCTTNRVTMFWAFTLIFLIIISCATAALGWEKLAVGIVSVSGAILCSYFFIKPLEIERYKQTLTLENKHKQYQLLMQILCEIGALLSDTETSTDCKVEKHLKEDAIKSVQKTQQEILRRTPELYSIRLYIPTHLQPYWEIMVYFPTCKALTLILEHVATDQITDDDRVNASRLMKSFHNKLLDFMQMLQEDLGINL